MDAAVYLRVQGMGAMIMAILTFFGLVILMPIFDSGDEAMRDFNRYSIANLSNMSSLLWAPAVMMWIFSLLCFVIIVKNYHEIYKLRLQSVGTGEGQEYAIMITGIPLEYDTEDKVKKDLQKKYPGEGLVVQIIRDESDLRKAVSRLKKENLKLIRAQQYKVVVWQLSVHEPCYENIFSRFNTVMRRSENVLDAARAWDTVRLSNLYLITWRVLKT